MATRLVHFATNRIWDGKDAFGMTCSEPLGRLLAGKVACEAFADPAREGSSGKPVIADPADPDTGLVDTLKGWLDLAHDEGWQPLLFVHGFNYSFEEAMRRTAGLCEWIEADPEAQAAKLRLAPFAFTWPSNGMGSLDAYRDDQKDSARSGLALARLIAAIAVIRPKRLPAYLAHSMGARTTRHAMEAILPMLPGLPRPVFCQAAIMAGDDVADVLDQPRLDMQPGGSAGTLRPIAELAAHVTIGVNPDDGVVWLVSGTVNKGDRLGTAGPPRPAELPPNLRVVDYVYAVADREAAATPHADAEMNWIGHQYFRNAPRTRTDLVRMLVADGRPEDVKGRREAQPNERYGASEKEGRLYVEP